jgi:hypothetical protein
MNPDIREAIKHKAKTRLGPSDPRNILSAPSVVVVKEEETSLVHAPILHPRLSCERLVAMGNVGVQPRTPSMVVLCTLTV